MAAADHARQSRSAPGSCLTSCTTISGATNTGNLQVDPQSHGDAALVIAERRAALRITDTVEFVPDLYVRDSVDDTGARGAVAWGARASDIIVVASAEADPTATFTNISDPREADVIRGQAAGAAADVENFIYVRVWNNKSVPLSTTVRLYYAPFDKLSSPADWTEVHDGTGSAEVPVNDIAPHSHKFSAEFQLTNPPDPAPGHDVQGGGPDRRGECGRRRHTRCQRRSPI